MTLYDMMGTCVNFHHWSALTVSFNLLKQILDIKTTASESEAQCLELDPEWLCILRSTNHLMRLTNTNSYMPGPGGTDRYPLNCYCV
jgi:Lariat debranching enzyme, C-terminal domain